MRLLYFDHAATTPVDPAVLAAMRPYLREEFGNPSARYPLGVRAEDALDRARARVARVVGARAEDVTFTSGGTEANNLAVLGAARAAGAGRVLVGATEHPSVREPALALAREGFEVHEVPLAAGGAFDPGAFERLLDADTVLVAQMLANNEVGTLYPVRELARRVRRLAPRAHVHVDAVQALGKVELSLGELGADSSSLSAHKVGGPKGAGALVTRAGVELVPLFFGGGQEAGRRSGTENVAGIVGLGEAARLAEERLPACRSTLAALHAAFLAGVAAIDGVAPLQAGGPGAPTVHSISSLCVEGAPAEVWLHHLEARGVCASAGSACRSRKGEVSPAFAALGLTADEARRVLRFSFGCTTTAEELALALEALASVAAELSGVRS